MENDRRDRVPIQLEISSGMGIISIRETRSGQHKDLLMASLQRALDSAVKGIIISFENYSAVNGAGTALLTRLLAEAKSAGTRLCIAGLSENFKTIFDMLGITRVAPCVDTVEAAVSAIDKYATV